MQVFITHTQVCFYMNKPLGSEYMYHRRRREDESRYLVARKVYGIFARRQCQKCSFVHLCGRFHYLGSLEYSQTLVVLRRANLDICFSRNTSRINVILGYAE